MCLLFISEGEKEDGREGGGGRGEYGYEKEKEKNFEQGDGRKLTSAGEEGEEKRTVLSFLTTIYKYMKK